MIDLVPPGTACSAGGGWTPALLGSDLKTWWNADDHGTGNMTDDGSGLISAWKDRISTISATGATTARPTWKADGLNGRAAVSFDGVANALTNASFAALPTAANGSELWALVSQTAAVSDTGARVAFSYGSSAASAARSIERSVGASRNRLRAENITAGTNDAQVEFLGAHVIQGRFPDANSITNRIDGRPGSSGSVAAANNTGTSILRLGALCTGSAGFFWQGVIRHVLVTAPLSQSMQMLVEGWLAWDAGLPELLPVGHPFRNRRP